MKFDVEGLLTNLVGWREIWVDEDSSPPGYVDVWIGTEDAAASIFRAFQEESGHNTPAEWLVSVQ
jgi:hypothetical protein